MTVEDMLLGEFCAVQQDLEESLECPLRSYTNWQELSSTLWVTLTPNLSSGDLILKRLSKLRR